MVDRASWYGGFGERLVASCKTALDKSLPSKKLTLAEFETALTGVEWIVNSRPLCYIGSDFDSGYPLTPNHLLGLQLSSNLPEIEQIGDLYLPNPSAKEELLRRWETQQRATSHFWEVWRSDYLQSLRERSIFTHRTWRRIPRTPQIGEVVLVGSPPEIKGRTPKGAWRLGLIVELEPSADGQVRAAKVKLGSGNVVRRALNFLVPLEVRSNNVEADRSGTQTVGAPREKVRKQPTRKAAVEGKKRLADLIDEGLAF